LTVLNAVIENDGESSYAEDMGLFAFQLFDGFRIDINDMDLLERVTVRYGVVGGCSRVLVIHGICIGLIQSNEIIVDGKICC
jgi:hypothetical protein